MTKITATLLFPTEHGEIEVSPSDVLAAAMTGLALKGVAPKKAARRAYRYMVELLQEMDRRSPPEPSAPPASPTPPPRLARAPQEPGGRYDGRPAGEWERHEAKRKREHQ